MHHVSPRWEDPRTVAGFVSGAPNQQLLAYASRFVKASGGARCLDLGCGAARNALPLAAMGFHVTGTDLSEPMLDAARERAQREGPALPVEFLRAPMAPLPFADASFDLIVAHGIWNLARSGDEFRAAVADRSNRWVGMVAELVGEAQDAGRVDPEIDAVSAGLRLTGVVDSLGSHLMLGTIERAEALREVDASLRDILHLGTRWGR